MALPCRRGNTKARPTLVGTTPPFATAGRSQFGYTGSEET